METPNLPDNLKLIAGMACFTRAVQFCVRYLAFANSSARRAVCAKFLRRNALDLAGDRRIMYNFVCNNLCERYVGRSHEMLKN